jgi:hypothetical protein
MKYMLLIYTDPSAGPKDAAEGEKLMNDYGTFTQAIVDSKELVAGDPLQGIETATSVRVRNNQTATTDGPFAETREHLGGYYVVDVKDLDRALELAAQIPDARTGVIEVRPVMSFPG